MRFKKPHRGLIDLRAGVRPKPHVASRKTPELRVVSFRRSPLRVRRRKQRVLIALAIVMVVAAVGYGVHRASYLPQVTIDHVEIAGVEHMPTRLVKAYVESVLKDGSYHIIARDNIFVYPKRVLESAVTSFFPRIRSAVVSRESLIAQAITVTIVERTPLATWCGQTPADGDRPCYLLDESGFIFADASSTRAVAAKPYVFTGGVERVDAPIGTYFEEDHIAGIIALIRLLESAGYAPLGADVIDGRDFHVPLEAGHLLKLSYGVSPSTIAHNLELVLVSETLTENREAIEYIDLRFGNRVYYKLRSEEEAPYDEEGIDVVQ
jgi:cell division septal protein FtsQ